MRKWIGGGARRRQARRRRLGGEARQRRCFPRPCVLLIGGVHGNEFGTPVAKRFIAYLCAHPGAVPSGARIDVIRCLNPDGRVRDTRGNARHVDLNRNLPTRDWKRALDARDEPGNPGLSGGRAPGSEPETKALLAYLKRGFRAIVSLHSHAGILDCDGPGAVTLGRRMSALCGLPVGRLSYDPFITGSLVSSRPSSTASPWSRSSCAAPPSDTMPQLGPLAQLVEHLTFNQGVRSSTLRRPTRKAF
jgi:hypothetical protein